eukprot:TRINITY_DN9908_c0_g1_i1.p1 TRINITY_DN9908_c0_g1~~TRINITY_DN9908_c0_g1_i1.p1  ORF type:complete len:322 (+),score=29.80 TRINITY_DN9908_c0_g1_i1:116-1081(+)
MKPAAEAVLVKSDNWFVEHLCSLLCPPDVVCLALASRVFCETFDTAASWKALLLRRSSQSCFRKPRARSRAQHTKNKCKATGDKLLVLRSWQATNAAKVQLCYDSYISDKEEQENVYMMRLASQLFSKDLRPVKKACQHRSPRIWPSRIFYGDHHSLASTASTEHPVHPGVSCHRCGDAPLRGSRFKCITCANVNACAKCHACRASWHPPHCFAALKPMFATMVLSKAAHYDVICCDCMRGIVISIRPLKRYEPMARHAFQGSRGLPVHAEYISNLSTTTVKLRLDRCMHAGSVAEASTFGPRLANPSVPAIPWQAHVTKI